LLIGSVLFPVLIFLVGAGVGTIAGAAGAMNFLPQAVACESSQSLCYNLRWDKSKVVLPEPPKQLKTSTSKSKGK